MFNSHQFHSDDKLIEKEVQIFNIINEPKGHRIVIGDESIHCASLSEIQSIIDEAIGELKTEIWQQWKNMFAISEDVLSRQKHNKGSVNNLLFLNAIKKTFLLSQKFSDLEEYNHILHAILNVDIKTIDPRSISSFNETYLKIRLLHYLIMFELYRKALVQKLSILNKSAQISGPWANLDLPYAERVWPWAEDEEYFDDRQKARRQQARYNPEYNGQGFYYVWPELASRDPYKFEDMKKNSPYKSRHQLLIASKI